MIEATKQDPGSVKRLARLTGLLYLIIFVFGMFSPIVLNSFATAGDAATTAANIRGALILFRASLVGWIIIVLADVAVSVTFYVLLRPVQNTLAMMTAAFRLVYSAMLGINLVHLFNAMILVTASEYGGGSEILQVNAMALLSLEAFNTGFLLGLIVFGVHCLGLGYLLYKSRYVPRILGGLLAAAGFGYIANSLGNFLVPGYNPVAAAVLLFPAVLGELGLTLWLLIKGVSDVETSVEEA